MKLKTGQAVSVNLPKELKADGLIDYPYYSGAGTLVAIADWGDYGTMLAVTFPQKGTIWFSPQDVTPR